MSKWKECCSTSIAIITRYRIPETRRSVGRVVKRCKESWTPNLLNWTKLEKQAVSLQKEEGEEEEARPRLSHGSINGRIEKLRRLVDYDPYENTAKKKIYHKRPGDQLKSTLEKTSLAKCQTLMRMKSFSILGDE